jgi:putative intracellular protease/amidase
MIFSICNGAQLLISSKILDGRTVSGYYAIDIDIENAWNAKENFTGFNALFTSEHLTNAVAEFLNRV